MKKTHDALLLLVQALEADGIDVIKINLSRTEVFGRTVRLKLRIEPTGFDWECAGSGSSVDEAMASLRKDVEVVVSAGETAKAWLKEAKGATRKANP